MINPSSHHLLGLPTTQTFSATLLRENLPTSSSVLFTSAVLLDAKHGYHMIPSEFFIGAYMEARAHARQGQAKRASYLLFSCCY